MGISQFFFAFLIFLNAVLATALAAGERAEPVPGVSPLVYDATRHGQFLGRHLYLTSFADRQTSPRQAWQQIAQGNYFQVDQERPNFGLGQKAYFGYLLIRNPSDQPQTVILENNFGMADYFDVYRAGDDLQWEPVFAGGDQVNIENRTFVARTMNTRLILEPGLNRILVKTYGDTCVQLPIRLWSKTGYQDQMLVEYLLIGLLVGIHVVMILYNSFLGFSLKDWVYLYYVVLVSSNVIYHISNFNLGQYLGWLVLGTQQYSNHIQLISVDCIIISAILFSTRFLDFKSSDYPILSLVFRGNIALSVINIAVFNWLSIWLTSVVTLIGAAVCVPLLALAGILQWRRGYRPAFYYLLGWTAYLIGSGEIVWVNLGVLEATDFNYWGQFVGGAFEVSAFSIALGTRINYIKRQNMNKIERLNDELTELNVNLEKKVEERTKDIREILSHIHQGIFTIRRGRSIDAEYSSFLERVLDRKDLTGQDVVTILRERSTLSHDALDQLANAIDVTIDQDEIGFLVNQHCFPKSVVYRDQNADMKRDLEFDWTNITDGGETQKLLVSVRDTTEQRHLRQQVADRNEELTLISQLVEVKPERFRQFTKVCEDLLSEVQVLLDLSHSHDKRLRNIFINYHTLKGLARTLNLTFLSDLIHQAETELNEFRRSGDELDLTQLNSTYEQIVSVFERYRRINDETLGRYLDPNVCQIPRCILRDMVQHTALDEVNDPKILESFEQLKTFYYTLIEDVFYEHLNSIKSICDQLDKPLPKFKFNNASFGLDARALSAFDKAVTHLVRNCIDHGIEGPAERLQKGKPERGVIVIEVYESQAGLNVAIFDDGRGLDLPGLKRRSVDLGLMTPDCNDQQTIIRQIFEPGFSTKSQVTDISGRGVGLDAVKSTLQEIGGEFDIQLRSDADLTAIEFALMITLPPDHYCRIDAARTRSVHVAA